MSENPSGIMKIIGFLLDKEVKFGKKLLFLFPLLYFVFPIDFIPDLFPFAGYLDDIFILVLMWPLLKSILSSYYNEKEYRGNSEKKHKDAIDIEQDDYEIH